MLVTMSDKDLSRYKVINDVCERRLRRKDAAQILNLSERQVQRLMNRLRQSGAASLVHGAAVSPVIIVPQVIIVRLSWPWFASIMRISARH